AGDRPSGTGLGGAGRPPGAGTVLGDPAPAHNQATGGGLWTAAGGDDSRLKRGREHHEAADSRFRNVATIIIPHQEFATPARDRFCETLSFTPWHALPQHRPLGAVNRMRRVAYEAISKLRHELNGTERELTAQDVP